MAVDLSPQRFGSKPLPKGAELTGEQIMAKANAITAEKNAKKANALVKDTTSFFDTVGTETNEENIFNAADFFEERKKEAEKLKQRAAALYEYMSNHADYYEQEPYDNLMGILSTFDTSVDDVMTRYQPSLDSKAGMAAYEDEYLAAVERNQQMMSLVGNDEESAYNSKDYSYRSVNDNWTAEQRYTLGVLQNEDSEKAKKYAFEVNKYIANKDQYEEQERLEKEMEALDLDAAKQEIDVLQKEIDNFYLTHDYTEDAEYQQKKEELSSKIQLYNQAKQLQKKKGYKALTSNEDFAANSGYVSTEAQNFRDRMFSEYGMGYNDLTYEYINDPERVQEYNDEFTRRMLESNYELMQNDEIAIYNYIHATEGKKAAEGYLDTIQEDLNRRRAEQIYSELEGNTAKEIAFAANAGVNSAMNNTKALLSRADYIPLTATQQASQLVRQDLQDRSDYKKAETGLGSFAPVAYDLINTTANMLPSIAMSTAANVVLPGSGAFVGAASMGASAAGGAYQQALNAGYSKEQARTYAALTGASEIGLEYMLGGISKLGGEIPQKVMSKMVRGIDDAIAKAAITVGGSMVSEGFEEGLQEVITPWIENLTLYTDKDVNWDDVAYSTLLGALSGGVMEAPGVAVNTSRTTKVDKQLQALGAEGNTLELAELIMKHRAGEKLSHEEYVKLAKSEPAMQVLNGVRNTDSGNENENESVAKDTPVTTPKVSSDGKAIQISTNETIETMDFASVNNGKATIQLKSGDTAEYSDVSFASEAQANQFYAAASLPGIDTENANDLLHTIQDADAGKDVDSVVGIREAYGIGYFGMQESDLESGDAAKLSPELRKAVFDIGRQQRAADAMVKATAKPVTAKPSSGYKKVVFEGKTRQITKKQKSEIEFVDYIAENFSGNTVHVFESYKGRDGKYYYRDNNGKVHRAPNGKYVNGEIWLDLKSGDNQEGLVLNTFAHEMYHHIEQFDKTKAQELAEFVAKELGKKSVDDAVAEQIKKARKAGLGESYFQSRGMTAEQARNEVYMRAMSDFVADSLETMFTRGDPAKAIANLKKENKTLFNEIKAFIDKWVSKLKEFYKDKTISKEGEMVAQLEKFEQLQQLFMEAMQGAGENYQEALKKPVESKKREDVAQFSNRFSGLITEQDQKYLDAINRGDMDAAQRMVEDAAKKAGYDSPKLYHGTNSFGFTKFDPHKSDDRISIFATSNSQVAETYSGETARRKMSEKATITPEALENASPEELLKLLQENISKEYRIVSDAERSQIIEANRKPLLEAARSIENLYVINMDMFDSTKKDALFAVSGTLRDMAKAEKYSDFMDKKMSYDDALWDLRWLDESLTDEVISAIGNKENLAFRELTKWLDNTMFHADSEYSKVNGTPWMNSVEAVNELYPRLFKGVYELYARTGNAFEMKADGANWNQLDGSKIGQYGPVRTRDVSRYAYDAGYDSVIFREIRDNADYTYSGNSDVYVFFGSNMLKSADTVTYDDDGNIIPLSERFNPEIDDVRYSTRNSDLTSQRYWYPAMKKSEIAEVKNLAKHEAKSTDNYLGIGVKWLYNDKKGHRYFALYSTADENSPTVLYACKGDQAEFEHNLLLDFIESERGLNESLNRGSTTIDRLFDSVRNAANRENVSSDRTLGPGSNSRNVSTNSRNRRKKASPAFKNCLRNLTKVQEKYGVNYDNSKNSLRNEKSNKKESGKSYKAEQKDLIQKMQTERRLIREELTGKKSDISIMEKEFIRLAKQYERMDTKTGKKSAKDARVITQLRTALKEEAKSHREDSKIWEREFNRLLRDYDTADRQIDRLEATIQRQRATAKARVDGRRNTEMRHKIQRKVNELDQLLRHGSKHRNVPEFLQSSVAEVLNAINMEVRDGDQRRKTYEATLARYDRQIAAATDPATVSRLIEKRNEYAAKGDQFANRMDTLKKAYDQIRKENTDLELDEGIAEHLNSLFETVGNTPLGQMTAAQMDSVNDILDVTMATVRNANEMLADVRAAGVVETSKSAITEIKSARETKKKKTRFRKGLEQFGWNNLKPEYAIEVIGSKTLKARYDALRKGEDTLAVDLNEAKKFVQEQWKKNGGKDWDMEQKWKFTSTSGKSFELDLNQIMSLYALAKDKDARSHLRVGGFAFDSDYQTKEDINLGPVKIPVKMESTDASAYNLSDEILGEIISKLTPQQRAFADAMQAYLSDTMAAKGNEVSLKKYGIRLFKKKDYFPIRVADQFMAKAREQQAGDRKLKDAGFTKDRKPEAKNPVVLSGFTEVWAEHVDEMSLYHSFVLPLDDFNRVLNYHDAFVEGEQASSVMEAITNAFGKGATNYIDQLIKDVNGGIKGGSTVSFANRMMSKAKKAQTMASLSVAIQQPSSILRSMSEVDLKYFLGPKVTEKTHDRTWNEIKEHAPIAIIKEMGGYDTNVGKSTVDYLTDTAEYNGFGEKFKAMFTDEKFRDDALGRLPALMDEMSWGVIWNAVKREQSDLHPGMDVKSDAFMKMVANRFTEVITRTQVYDSVFSRSGLMRDRKSDLAKMTTSFMAEPTTTANMLAVSILQAKRGDIPKKQAAKTTASIVASLALNAALVSVVYALRDDDEDKRYGEKWIENFYSNFFESLNPLGYIPYVRDIYNLFVKGYDVERADMELYGDLQNAIDGLDNDDLSAWEKTENVIGAIGNLVGVPLKNILRDSGGLVKTFFDLAKEDDGTLRIVFNKEPTKTKTGKYMARRGMDLSDGEELLLAIQRGDDEHIQRVAGRYENQQEAEGALQRTIREKYKSGDLTREEAEELLTTNFDREDEHEVYWLLEEMDYAKEHGSSDGYAKYGALYEAVESGGDYEGEIARLMEHGAEASTIRSQVTKKYHKQYLEGDEDTQKNIREKILPVLEAAGLDEAEIEEKFNSWDFESEYGMTYSEMKAEYRNGDVTENEMRNAMKFYGLKNFEVEETMRSLNDEIAFVNKYDMTLSEMKDSYDDGDVTRNQMTNALIFTGMTQSEAKDWVTQRDIENRYGIDYAKLDDAYKHDDISRQTLYNSMIENGATKQEADDAILGYDWLKKHVKQYPDLTISVAKKFAVRISADQPDYTLEDFNVKVDDYIEYSKLRPDCKGVDNNGDGQADSGTKRDAIFKMIDSLPISSDAKDGLALIDYGMKSIRKNAPWH